MTFPQGFNNCRGSPLASQALRVVRCRARAQPAVISYAISTKENPIPSGPHCPANVRNIGNDTSRALNSKLPTKGEVSTQQISKQYGLSGYGNTDSKIKPMYLVIGAIILYLVFFKK